MDVVAKTYSFLRHIFIYKNLAISVVFCFSFSGCKRTNVSVSALGSLVASSSTPTPGVATLVVPPTTYVNAASANYTVGGTNVSTYKFKAGADASTDCANSTGYSTEYALAVPLTAAGLSPDGLFKICLVGKDPDGNWQDFSAASNYSFTVDTTLPYLTSINSTSADGIYYTMSAPVIPIQVTFSEAVIVTGTPTLSLNVGGTVATYVSGSGTTVLTFNYTLGSSDVATDLDATALTLIAGSTITDVAGNTSALAIPANSLATQKDIQIFSMLALSINPVYSSNANWMEYVKYSNNGVNIYSQTDTSCDGTETASIGKYGGCLHGGELKKIEITGVNSCTNLALSESLGVFEWECIDTSGTAVFYSKGLKQNKGLKDLISTSGTWNSNIVTVTSSGTTIGTSSSTPNWWSNALTPLSDNSSGTVVGDVVTLSSAGTIYYTTAPQSTIGYYINGNKVAIVTLGSSYLQWSGANVLNCNTPNANLTTPNAKYIICGGNNLRHLWIEASLKGSGATRADGGLIGYLWKFSQIRNTTMSSFLQSGVSKPALMMSDGGYNLFHNIDLSVVGSAGIYLYLNTKNILSNIRVSDTLGVGNTGGITVKNSTQNTFYDISVSNVRRVSTGNGGIYLDSSSQNKFMRTHISNIQTSNTKGGIFLNTSSQNIFIQATTTSTENSGILLDNSSNTNIFLNTTSANNYYNSIYVIDSHANFFSNVAAANTDSAEVIGTAGTIFTANTFSKIAVGNVASQYRVNLASSGGSVAHFLMTDSIAAGACGANSNVNGSCDWSGTAFTRLQQDFKTSWVGMLSFAPTDTVNASTTAHSSNIVAFDSITDWIQFIHPFRLWGVGSGFGFSTSTATVCVSGDNCGVWDWALQASDPILRNTVFEGSPIDFTGTNSNLTCPVGSAFEGNNESVTNKNYATYYMRHAIELIGYGGNDNGLCESGESCVFAPNLGSYQGHGALSSTYCTSSGSVNGAKIYQYSTNGY